MSTETDYETLAYVTSSEYRIDVVESLDVGPGTPTEVSEDIDRSVAHASRALQELRDVGVVELLVPEGTKKGRIHGLTDVGEAIVPMIHDRSER